MKKLLVCLVPALALLFLSTVAGRADEFSRIENSPYTYWVPAPPGYANAGPYQPGYYGPPPPGYYGPYGPPPGPPPPPAVVIPHFFIGFHFH